MSENPLLAVVVAGSVIVAIGVGIWEWGFSAGSREAARPPALADGVPPRT